MQVLLYVDDSAMSMRAEHLSKTLDISEHEIRVYRLGEDFNFKEDILKKYNRNDLPVMLIDGKPKSWDNFVSTLMPNMEIETNG
jgi:hypothetical protein